ncbi:MAG: hypothetical protein KGV44_00295 [Flavobacteriaceae bacterium]|nr:hypothetical protein [Flavobacteriaceae bacterium]
MLKDKIDNAVNSEYAKQYQMNKAKKALKKAKELEKKAGKKPVRLNKKTIVLR